MNIFEDQKSIESHRKNKNSENRFPDEYFSGGQGRQKQILLEKYFSGKYIFVVIRRRARPPNTAYKLRRLRAARVSQFDYFCETRFLLMQILLVKQGSDCSTKFFKAPAFLPEWLPSIDVLFAAIGQASALKNFFVCRNVVRKERAPRSFKSLSPIEDNSIPPMNTRILAGGNKLACVNQI